MESKRILISQHLDKSVSDSNYQPATSEGASPPILPEATQRFDTIDALRGFSILAVVLLHTWLRLYFAGYDIRRPSLPDMVARLIFFNGGNGDVLGEIDTLVGVVLGSDAEDHGQLVFRSGQVLQRHTDFVTRMEFEIEAQ